MALIMTMLKNAPAEPRETEVGGAACVNPRCVSMFEKYLPNLTYEREGRVFCEYCDKEI
jgi:aspartate carbamoyltransferase regulatory subunit